MTDGMIHFRNGALTDMQTSVNRHKDDYTEIWEDVRRQLRELIDGGMVDAQLGGVLDERDLEFRRQAGVFDEGVTGQNTAVRNVQVIGQEGGSAMLRAARGGR